jgi:cell division protein FtsB
MVTAMMIAFATPAFAGISGYESVHKRLADVLGSRAQADAAYDKLMKEVDTYGQPIDSVVDLFIAVCTASDECNP